MTVKKTKPRAKAKIIKKAIWFKTRKMPTKAPNAGVRIFIVRNIFLVFLFKSSIICSAEKATVKARITNGIIIMKLTSTGFSEKTNATNIPIIKP